MEVFYGFDCDSSLCRLDAQESTHCVRVLRHREGDEIDVIDGFGTLYHCRLTLADARGAEATVLETHPGWHALPYSLTIACCPTKNNERFEWFVEKATEMGVDCIVPLIGERSERKVYKTERAQRIALSATKQSLKARIPEIREPISVKDFLEEDRDGVKMIACCFEPGQPRKSIRATLSGEKTITVLIGPEGDFSTADLDLARSNGY
ncbi:MAG: 16S rRNA (uracil(1498)-N(3))-methyltransferase, partial [Bacteroidales bacterium]|nr:16S rRNA (uracil(1498)-N(3))-methyltransferase [Bacteroidales bacterium]